MPSSDRNLLAKLSAAPLSIRWTAAVVAALMLLSGTLVAQPHSGVDGFPIGGLRRLFGGFTSGLAAVTGLPVQNRGGRVAGGHVAAAATDAHQGAGLAPGDGIGALPAAAAPTTAQQTTTTVRHTGFVAGVSKRIPSAASATSDVYQNPDGSYTRRVYQHPINARTADGAWTPIDTTLQRGGDGRLRAGQGVADLAGHANDPALVTIQLDESHALSYGLAGAADVAPVVKDDTAVYPEVLPGVDLSLESLASGTKESLVLRSADVPTSYSFPLRLRGLTARLEADGSITLRDSGNAVRATIPQGSMSEARMDSAPGAVHYRLDGEDLTIVLDQAWLHDRARVFPVTVDPTVALDSNGDTYAKNTESGDKSASSELITGTYDGGTDKAYSFIRFGAFGTSFAGAQLSAVSLKLYDYWAYTCTAEQFKVNKITESWTPQTVTSYPGPSWSTTLGTITVATPHACANSAGDETVGDWLTVPLDLATMQGWALGTTANYGFAITSSQTSSYQWKRFVSDNGPANYNPYLSVSYAAGVSPQVDAQYPESGYAAPTLTPELLVNAHDPDDFPSALTYDFAVYNSAGTKTKESGWISSKSWVVPAGTLSWGQTYNWTVTANDGYSTSVSQTVNQLTTPVPQPLITSSLNQNGGAGFDPDVGNYTTEATDASIDTVGPALAIDRSYNSRDPRTGLAFGSGWSSIADAAATENDDSAGVPRTVAVTYPGGEDVVFGRDADGSYAPPQGRYANFSAVTGGYQLVDKDGSAYTFTSATTTTGHYRLSSIADAQGRTETFSYASGELGTITSVSGRALHLTWTTPTGASAPHVATVSTDSDASTPVETWTYTYSGDLLTKVCPPTSTTACPSYGYGTSSLYPTALTDANPRSYWHLGEASGTTVTSAVVDNYGTDNGTYHNVTLGATGPLAGSTATGATFNGSTSEVQLPANLVSTGSYLTVAMWFKAAAGDSGPLFSYQKDAIGNATTAGNYTPALYVGTSGKLHGELWDGVVGAPISTSASVADGAWHYVVLSGAGSSQSMYVDGALIGSLSLPIQTIDSYSVANEYLGAGFWGGGWPDEPHYVSTPGNSTGYPAFFKGSISDAAYFDRPLSASEATTLYATGKVAAHPLHTVVRASGNPTATVDYDATTGAMSQLTDANGGVWKLNPATVSGSSQIYASAVLGAGPVDYWRMGETGTTDAINQVNGSTASYDGVTLGIAGPFPDAKVAQFDGTASKVDLPASYIPTSGPESVSLWFKTTTANRVLLSYSADSLSAGTTSANYTPALYVGASGKLLGRFWHGVSTLTSTKAVTDNLWHHVVLAAGTASQSMYVDGALVGTTTGTVAQSGQVNAYLGAGFLGGSWTDQTVSAGAALPTHFHGQIGEVAFYHTQLTAAQVTAQYTARDATSGTPARTVRITDPGGKTISHVYDVGSGLELSESDSLGNETQYGYDTGGFLRTVTDPNGNITTTEHDVRGNTVSSTTCQDRSASKCSTVYYTYYPDATTKTLTPDPRNDVLLTMRDGRSASATDNTYLTQYTHDAKGNRTAVTDPLGHTVRTGYTDGTTGVPAGLPNMLTTAGGATQTITYTAGGDIATVTDPVGLVTAYSYDVLGRVKSKKETSDSFPSGLTTSYTYDNQGRPVAKTDPATTDRVTGAIHTQVTTTAYDVDGLVTSSTLSDTTGGDAARVEKTTYNTDGQQATVTDASGNVTAFGYDAYGNPVTETDADGMETVTAYDSEGNLVTTTLDGYTGDPNNPSTAKNLVVEGRTYDPAGRLASVTDAMGWVTSYTYTDNGLNAKTTRTDPSTGATFVSAKDSYDAAGNLIQVVGSNGAATTNYVVDSVGRPSSATFDPGTLKRTRTYTYNRDDQLVNQTLSDASGQVGSTDMMYDPMGRVIAETTLNGSMVPVLRYKLNQSAADSAGNNAGTATGVTWSTDHSGSATFNGTTSVVTSAGPAVDTAGSFTVSAWVDLTTAQSGKAVSATNGFELRYDLTTNKWQFGMGSVTASSSSTPVLNTWTHLTGGYNAATGALQLYVNGALQASATDTSPVTARGPLLVGSAWKGGTSDVQVYSRVLTAAEVSSVYGGTAPAAGAGVIRTSYAVDQYGLARATTDPDGAVTNEDYDEAGRLSVTTGPAVMTETNGGTPLSTRPVSVDGYDTFGERVEEQDPNGNVVTTGYDAEGNELTTKLPAYTPPGGTTAITPVTVNAYDKLGQLVSTSDPLSHVTSYRYDQLGHLAKITQQNGAAETYTYDANGDELTDTDPTGAQTAVTYDFLGRPVTSTEAVRQNSTADVTSYTYGTAGLLASVRSPAGMTTGTTYDAAGEPATETDGAGDTTSYAYDAAGRPTKTTLSDGTYTAASYDPAGREIADKSYDSVGTLLKSTSDSYDPAGNVLASTDARGTTTTYAYDPTGLLTSQVQPISASDSITTSYGYDAGGNTTRFTDGRGHRFLTTYNVWDLRESTIEPATTAYPNAVDRTFTVSYDADGQPTRQLSPGAVSVSDTYDTVGNLTKQTGTGAEGATADRTFGYDLDGRVTSATAVGGQDSFTYDDRGDLLTASGPSGASSFNYTPDGLMATRTDAAGTTNYGYDTADRLKTVANAGAGLSASLTYDALSDVKTIAYTSGDTRSLGYDSSHRLTSDEVKTSAGTSLGKITYGYDANDNITAKNTTGFAGAANNTYTYDLSDRLTAWTAGTTTTAYAYDKAGNRTQAGSHTFTYDERDSLISSNDGSAYQYTARGTLRTTITPTGQTLATIDDAFNQTLSQQGSAATETYTYDALGRALRSGFSYTGTANDLASDGTTAYTRGPEGDLLAEASGTSTKVAWTDQHDDVVGQFDAAGTALSGSITYDPLGKVLNGTGMIGNLGFQSEWTDSLTGRVDMLSRWYNTDTGQFDSRDSADVDPTADALGANRFAYGDDNPLGETDPTGQWGIPKIIKKITHAAVHYVAHKAAQAVNVVKTVYRKAKHVAKKIIHKVRQIVHHVVSKVRHIYHKIKRYVAHRVSQGRRWVAHQVAHARQRAVRAYQHAKQAGKAVTARVARATAKAAARVRDASVAAQKFVKDHKNALIEIAAVGVGILGALACTAATAGAGAVACMAGASALINVVKDAAEGDIHSWGDLARSAVTGAAEGAAGSFGGMVGGKFAVGLSAKLGTVAASFVGRRVLGAADGAISDAVTQVVTTGHLDARGVLESAGIGAVFGGRVEGGEARRGPPEFDGSSALAASCRPHSFAPDTKVLMADGSTRPIMDVNVGDRVESTDPKTGRSTGTTVALLHINHDTQLTDVTLSSGAVLHTTQHHPFWDRSTRSWVDAGSLVPGRSSVLDPSGNTVKVAAVHNFEGSQEMRDLTLSTVHTYYVLAAATPVLVHNCGEVGGTDPTNLGVNLFGSSDQEVSSQPANAEPNRDDVGVSDAGELLDRITQIKDEYDQSKVEGRGVSGIGKAVAHADQFAGHLFGSATQMPENPTPATPDQAIAVSAALAFNGAKAAVKWAYRRWRNRGGG
jgi:RHS repeat-associated protein